MEKVVLDNEYYSEINIARGIALIAVLLGHSFPDAQTGITNPIAQWIVSAMYSFHMGCFFFLSGFVSAKTLCAVHIEIGEEIVKKLKRLMVPYLFYSLITLGLKQVFAMFANNQFSISEIWKIFIGQNPNGGMWYLWTLFVISVLCLFLNKLNLKASSYVGFGMILLALYYIAPSTFLDSLLGYSIYYSLGIFVHQNYTQIRNKLEGKEGITAAIISAVLFIGFVSFIKVPYVVTCILGILVVMVVSISISNNTETSNYRILNELGSYSYDIYLISYFVQVSIRVVFYSILKMPYWLVVLMMLGLGTIVPYYLCKYVIRKISVLNKLMLGNWK